MRFATTQIKAAIVEIVKCFEISPANCTDSIEKKSNSRFLVDVKSIVKFRRLTATKF